MIHLLLAESSLELVPKKLQTHPSVTLHARRMQKRPSEILLDNSWHFAAMKGIKNEIKRGRPDLAHIATLASTATPLYRKNHLDIYIHTIGDYVISVGSNVRIPKSYHRFAGLVEKLFKEGSIKAGKNTLLKMDKKTLPQLIDELNPSSVVGLSTTGVTKSFEEIGSEMDDNTCIVIGAFQKGDFSESTQDRIDKLYSVGDLSYEAHLVISRIIYEYEKTIFI